MTIDPLKKKYIPVNLQLFAGGDDKTEKATPKRRQDARKKGQVLQSKEITSAFVLLFIFVGLRLLGGYMYNEIVYFTKVVLTEYVKVPDLYTINGISKLFILSFIELMKISGPILAIALITGLIAEYAQVGFLFTFENLGFKFSRINPLSGLKRIFSLRSVVELIKSIIKLVIVGFIAYSYIKSEAGNLLILMDLDAIGVAAYIASTVINISIRICIALIFIGAVDYIYQWYEFEKSLKMSKQEIKEEFKQTEGNPEIKSKIRQKQRQISMRRMLNDVPSADVVITNPTHFAVAIKYDANVSPAPKVIAKGQDYMAQRIKEVAKENKVEIVENKPLARSLYDSVEVGQEIPEELYQAVAEILAFVYGIKNGV
ncbi:flagellar biosynthesis protein FlhB [Pseudobacteroides cellulosolvens]|uniref:Flagellar biosynthetic protein FlhB n=1 Tax=Pseudobacteroides cellulosolvens ATCC 35603 = DSM 2933 TaxID=398512 RepID=A0A0L6JRP9_9FIRM|nr:flagellar biosynthesis protein FlhB [Pseudobacteroides cellulosolvens]KNY28365.1 flagellar biosynthetic protein FlhB [Pseudobacteroides cellulosolvens ATCC 35603 = DSM 2933]